MLAGALSGYLTTHFGGSDPRTLGLVMGGVGVLAVVVVLRGRPLAA